MASPLLLALPALLLLQAQPTFYGAWEDGRDAERRGQFREALAAYQRAAALRPKPAARVVIYGNNLLQGYYPYTRIARCCLELGQPEAAQGALAQAEHLGEPAAERQALAARMKVTQPRELPAPVPPATVPAPSAGAPMPPTAMPPTPPQALVPATLPGPASLPAPPPPPPLAASGAAAHPRAPEPRTPPAALAPTGAAPAPPLPTAPPQPASVARLAPWGLAALMLVIAAAFSLGRRRRRHEQETPREPERIGPYRLERLLGRGGFASTYLAHREGGRGPVALKLLHAFRQEDPEFLGRFRQEARLGALLDHPHIVRLLDQGPQEDTPWLVMEYVEGTRLDVLLKDQGRLPLPLVADLARQLASAMAYAHGKGVIHRDLKPANVMIMGDQAKVMDFGIARIMDAETLTTTYAFLGTPRYAAPELQLRTQVGPAADRYSFGIMLFEMITGAAPFQGDTPFAIMDQHRQAELPDLAALRPETPEALVDLVRGLTLKDPARRPGDDEVLAVLAGL